MTASKLKFLTGRTSQLTLLLSIIFLWAHWPTLVRTLKTWQSDPDYTHGFLVVPIALAIGYRRYVRATNPKSATDDIKPTNGPMTVAGLWLIAFASILRIVAAKYYLMPLDAWSIPLWIGGAVLCFGGWPAIRVTWPAIMFLWFAAPLPDRAEQLLSLPLQERAAAGSAWILQCLQQPAVASGTTLLLGAEVFEVEHACSGLRMFFGSFAMATAFIFLASKDRATSTALFLAAAPIAIFANIIRIVITTMLVQHASTDLARRFAHDFAGLLMVGVVFGSFMLLLSVVQYGERSYRDNRDRFVRWLPVWPVGLAAAIIVAVVWHHRQQDQVNQSLLEAASAYEAVGDWRRASGYLKRYLQLNENDNLALRRLGNALNRDASRIRDKRRALTVMTAAWKANPEDLEFAMQQAELAMELRRYSQVVDTTAGILADERIHQPGNEELHQLAARWRAIAMYESLGEVDEYAPFNWPAVAEALAAAISVDSDYPQHAFRLAIVYRERLRSPAEAERNAKGNAIIDQLVNRSPESSEAWLVRYRYQRRYNDLRNANAEEIAKVDADLQRAIELDARSPRRNVHILIAAAERAHERGDVASSFDFYEQALRANAKDVRPYLAIAAIQIDQSTPDSRQNAVDILRLGLKNIGENEVPLLFPLMEQLTVLGQNAEADEYDAKTELAIERYSEPVQTSYRIQLQHVRSWRLAKRGEFANAAKGLAERLTSLPSAYQRAATNYLAQSWANTAQYYRMAGDWKRVAECYQRAAALDDNWRMEYRWALAHQNEADGKLESALHAYREIAISEATLDAWLDAGSVALRQQVLLPRHLRNWNQFRRAIDSAKAVAEDRLDEVVALEVNQWLVLGQPERVIQILTSALAEQPQSELLYRSLAMVQAKQGDFDAALDTARKMPNAYDDPTNGVLLQKELLCRQGRNEEAIQLVTSAIEADGPKQLTDLRIELAQLYMQAGDWPQAKRALDAASEGNSGNVRVIETLSQFAWCVQDWALLERCESSLRLMEGSYGPLWRTFRIRRILAQSADTPTGVSRDTTVEVDDLARQLESLYPHMQQTRIAAGRVASYRGLLWKAVANYEEAWELGLPRVSLAVELVGLLNELGETERAQRYVQEVRRYLSAARDVIDDSVLERAHESADEAIHLAETIAAQNPRSESFLRLGRTLVLTAFSDRSDFKDRLDRAEAAFRRAVEIDPANTRTWAALFRYLVSVRPDPVESQSVLRRLADNEQISLLNRRFALAQLNESIGNLTTADREYTAAIELAKQQSDPGERVVVLERAAQYFRHHQPDTSEACCREALTLAPQSLGPQQILLNLLLRKKTLEAIDEAEKVASSLDEQWLMSDPGRRLQAEIWMQAAKLRDEPTKLRQRRAIDALEHVTNKSSNDTLRLAELRLIEDDRAAAVTRLSRLVQDLPSDVYRLLDFLRTYDDKLYADTRSRLLADQLYDRLEELPKYRLDALDARVETMLARQDRPSYAARQTGTSLIINRYIRRTVDQATSDREKFANIVQLMKHLVETNRWEYAQQLTQLTPELLPLPRPASALATALAMCDPELQQVKLLSTQFDPWLADYPDDSELIFAVANLHLTLGENTRAAEMYRRCLKRNPNHAMLRNNLALSLAFGDLSASDESLSLVTEAIELGGRQPEFLDTLALIKIMTGHNEEAADLLLESIAEATPTGVQYLHLARAWANLDQDSLARYAFEMSLSRQVEQEIRLPYDHQVLEQLTNEFRESADNE